MDALYGWVKNIIYYMIFTAAVNNLLADSKYEKYIRFFAGMVLILLVVSPAVSGLRLNDQVAAMFERFSLEEEAKELKEEMLGMEEAGRNRIIRQYEECVEEEAVRLAGEQGLRCQEAQVRIGREPDSESFGKVEEIILKGVAEKEQEPEAVRTDAGVEGSRVTVGPVRISREEESMCAAGGSEAVSGISEKKIEGLKRRLAEYYEVEAENIRIQQ